MKKMATCTHGNGRALCFECFKAGMEKTRARQAAWPRRETRTARDIGTKELLMKE